MNAYWNNHSFITVEYMYLIFAVSKTFLGCEVYLSQKKATAITLFFPRSRVFILYLFATKFLLALISCNFCYIKVIILMKKIKFCGSYL